jgi:P27 family predicted phage terminase small subunit
MGHTRGGRRPKPIELKLREGNPGRRTLPDPVVLGGRPSEPIEPPEALDEDAKDFWREAIPIFHRVGLLDTIDRAALEMTATAYARVVQCRRAIQEHGMFSRGSKNQFAEHPALASERVAMTVFLRFAEQYALTPLARTRLGMVELQRRSMQDELADRLGKPVLERAD